MLDPQTPPQWSLYSRSYFSVDNSKASLQEQPEKAQQTTLGPELQVRHFPDQCMW